MPGIQIEGIVAYLVTPFTGAVSDIDGPLLETMVERLIDSGVHAIAPLGSTGEGAYLQEDEWRMVAELSCRSVARRLPTIVGIAEVSTAGAVRRARFAQDVGADAVMVLPVSYWKLTDDEIFRYFADISEALTIPVMAYNNPATSGTDMSPELIVRMAREIDNVEMIKESSGDVGRMEEIQRLSGGTLPIFNGYNPNAMAAFVAGASGWCTAAPNLIPALNLELYEKTRAGDLEGAKASFERQLPLLEFILRKSLPATIKSGLEIVGIAAGEPRGPILPLSIAESRELATLLDRIGDN